MMVMMTVLVVKDSDSNKYKLLEVTVQAYKQSSLAYVTPLLYFSPQALGVCCPGAACYDVGFPWITPDRLVPLPTCVSDPVKYLYSDR
jgi:hypothetical protein